MKKLHFLLYLLSSIIVGCSTVEGIKVKNRKPFSRKEIKSITEYYFTNNEKTTHLFINDIVVKKIKKNGLFGFTYKNLINSGSVSYKVLKFNDSFFIFSDDNPTKNQEHLKEFENKYGYLFTSEQLKLLKESFNKGTDLNFRAF